MADSIYLFYDLLFVMAFLYDSVGHGGASGYLALMAIFRFSPQVMKPTAVLLNLFVSAVSFNQFYHGRYFKWKMFLPLALALIPMAFVGGLITLDGTIYKKIPGLLLIIPIIRFLFFPNIKVEEIKKSNIALSILIGAAIGFLSGLIGIGCGILLALVLLLLKWTDQKATAAISAAFIFVNSLSGLFGQLTKGLHFSPDMYIYVGIAIVASLPGAYFSSLKFKQTILKIHWGWHWPPVNYYLPMHKKISKLVVAFLIAAVAGYAQEKTTSSDKFVIEGKVKNSFSFSLDQASQYKAAATVDSIVIYNHLMQRRHAIKNIKGILLKDVIDKAVIDMSSPKLLSEIYITCIASDNYKVVFSWNELYNTEVGKHVMIITESDGKPAKDGPDRIALISTADEATGRRYVKALTKILIEQVK